MSSINKKKCLLVGGYTLVLALAVFLCFLFFIRSDIDLNDIPQIFYYTSENRAEIAQSSVTSQQLHDYFRQAFFEYLPLLIAAICFFILLFSGILLYAISRLDRKHNDKIANDLMQVAADGGDSVDEPFLKEEYRMIHQRLAAFEEDQRRLHSYIAHEQKNLIMLIKGRLQGEADPNIQKDIEKLSESVDDILALSAHQDTQKAVCDLAMIAAEECDRYHGIYPQLHFDFEEDGGYTVMGKEQWLRRALDNLIENAVKYGENKPIDVFLKQKHNSVLLYVQDHGKGMNEEEQERIFDYGYRIHALKKDGYGIGLSLVCHVCDLCGGFINVRSEPGKGSLFILSFPFEYSNPN